MKNRSQQLLLIKHQKGFTLIEVLVASFILFLVIAAVSMVYRGALLSSNKAERTLVFSSLVAPISEQVRIQITSSKDQLEMRGSGNMGELTFSWHAISTYQSKMPEQFNAFMGEVDSGDKVFKLWQVTMQLQIKSATRQYQFSEISW
jgi:prepilin-type N-terminal cleavage/methylation domain-containing protein